MAKSDKYFKLNGLEEVRRFFLKLQSPIYIFTDNPSIFNSLIGPIRQLRISALNPSDLTLDHISEEISGLGDHVMVISQTPNLQIENFCQEKGAINCNISSELAKVLQAPDQLKQTARKSGISVWPSITSQVEDYGHLRKIADGFGKQLHLEFEFKGKRKHLDINSQDDFDKHSEEILNAREVTISRPLQFHSIQIPACLSEEDVLIGPLLIEIMGKEGAVSGIMPESNTLDSSTRKQLRKKVKKFGELISKKEMRGVFSLRFLCDKDSDEIYLESLTIGFSYSTLLADLSATGRAIAPFAYFHLLAFLKTKYQIDVDRINDLWQKHDENDCPCIFFICYEGENQARIENAPDSGKYSLSPTDRLEEYSIVRQTTHLKHADGVFFQICRPVGSIVIPGDIMGFVVLNAMSASELNLENQNRWIEELRIKFIIKEV
jgi:hypothetical protein